MAFFSYKYGRIRKRTRHVRWWLCGASSQTHAAAWELPFFVVGLEQRQPEQQQLEKQLRLPDGRPILLWVLVLVGACQSGTVWAGLCLIHHHQ